MIFLILIIIFFLLFVLSRYALRDKLSLNFLIIYQIWWFVLLMVSALNPFELYEVSNYTYFLLILNVFFFSIGFVISRLTNRIQNLNNGVDFEIIILESYNKTKNNKFFIFFILMFSALILNYLLKYQRAILLDGVEGARLMRFYVGNVFSSQVEIYFYNYVIESFSILVCVFLAFSFVWMEFNRVFFLCLIFAYLFSAFGSGRGYIIELSFLISFLFLIKNTLGLSKRRIGASELLMKNRIKKLMSFLVIGMTLICFYLFSIYLSNLRSGLFEINYENFIEGNNYFLEQIVVYAVGSFRALDYGINILGKEFTTTLGSLSFGGLDELIGFFLNALGIDYKYSNSIYGELTSNSFRIGYDMDYNALFTGVFVQYLDFGVLGVIFLSFFWGYIFNRFVVSFMNKYSLYKLLIVSYLFIIAIMSVLSWKLQAPSTWIFLIFLIYLENKLNIKCVLYKIFNVNFKA